MLLTKISECFKQRRDELMKRVPQGIFLFPSNPEWIRNGDVRYPYRQESFFYYLTGFEEPHSFLILVPSSPPIGQKKNNKKYKMILFVQPSNPEKVMWEGEMYGLEGAKKVFGADEVYPISELPNLLPEFLMYQGKDSPEEVFYHLGYTKDIDSIVLKALETRRQQFGRSGLGLQTIRDSWGILSEQRLIKLSDEIKIIKKSCMISAGAHREAMMETKPGKNEREIEAIINASMRRQGCDRLGYESIVASGKNATCLHYHWNQAILKDGDLLLIDAGGEYQYYTADISRTFPVGEKFTQPQSELYHLVLNAQKRAIKMVKPGVTLSEIHKKTCEWMIEGYLSLGLLKGNVESILKKQAYKRFYPHGTSHWLGLDVHDVGSYQNKNQSRKLEAGMIFTIEPGFYSQPSDLLIPQKYRNIGIRIEDDILVTESGYENLTEHVPKEIEEIEELKGSC